MRFTVVTIFPEMFESFLAASLLGKAREAGLVEIDFVDPRDFTTDRHRSVDDAPYGGGPGMVMKAEPLLDAIESVGGSPHRVLLAPVGAPLTQPAVRRLAGTGHIVLVCGRYEGIDERVTELAIDETLSIGDYVLSGGEAAALVVIDAVSRLVPGVLGDAASAEEESFAADLLEYPQYTRPLEVRGLPVPEVLTSGNHEKIRRWRRGRSLERTRLGRPDLFGRRRPSSEDRELDAGAGADRSHVVLLHHPVLDRRGDVVTSSVTNLDIHDIARSVSTYGLAGYWPVTPVAVQRDKIAEIAATWRELAEVEATDNRNQALASVTVAASLEDALARIAARHGGAEPLVVATSARAEPGGPPVIDDAALRAELMAAPDRPLAVVFGTGWGIAPSALDRADRRLEPIAGIPEFNHLAVRSAVAVILDRCFGCRPRPNPSRVT